MENSQIVYSACSHSGAVRASSYTFTGITRGVVLEVARENGIPVQERPIQVEELLEVVLRALTAADEGRTEDDAAAG